MKLGSKLEKNRRHGTELSTNHAPQKENMTCQSFLKSWANPENACFVFGNNKNNPLSQIKVLPILGRYLICHCGPHAFYARWLRATDEYRSV